MIPEPGHTELNFTDLIILLGVVQGILLSVTGLFRQGRKEKCKALLYFFITCTITEIFLNRTGYMYYMIPLVDFSEPFQFAVPPLIYLIILSINPDEKLKHWRWHFIPFIAYTLFFIPFYLAPNDFKLESYYFMHHFVRLNSSGNYEFLKVLSEFRRFQLFICILQTTIYLVLNFQILILYKNHIKENPLINRFEVNLWLAFNIALAILTAVVLVVKMTFPRDIGDHLIATFLTAIIYFSTITELVRPTGNYASISMTAEKAETPRNPGSGVKDEKKTEIQQKLITLMTEQKLYANSLISVEKLAKLIGEPGYVISQVINKKMEVSFYNWIARCRVEEAKRLMTDPKTRQYTVEQIAEEVGYNSKSAFNKAFKKFTSQTPSEYKNINNTAG